MGYSRGVPSSEGTLAGEDHDNPSSLWRLGAPHGVHCRGRAIGESPHLFKGVPPADVLGMRVNLPRKVSEFVWRPGLEPDIPLCTRETKTPFPLPAMR